MPTSVPLDNNAQISVTFPEPLMSADTPHVVAKPRISASMEITLCSHSLATSSWMSTLTVMKTMASCCSSDVGTSISQLTACPAERTSDCTPEAVPCR